MATTTQLAKSTAPPRTKPLGRIAPLILAACFLLDVALRLVPPEWSSFRAWEAVRKFPLASGPFTPSYAYRNTKSYGDLANMANLPGLRSYRLEIFHSDRRGFRNRSEPAVPFRGILLTGDSFAAGSGVSDGDALGEQLAAASGVPVYNAAGWALSLRQVSNLRMSCGLVIWEMSERGSEGIPLQENVAEDLDQDLKWRLLHRIADHRTYVLLYGLWSYSPLRVLFSRAIRSLQNDRILPNPERNEVVVARLRNGDEFLFLPSEVKNYQQDRPTDPSLLLRVQSQLAARGIAFLVLLVPDKYVVYHDLLLTPGNQPGHGLWTDIAAERLRSVNIPAVNLTHLFRTNAERLLASRSYLYWPDDSHWSAEGIREAATEIVRSGAAQAQTCRPAP